MDELEEAMIEMLDLIKQVSIARIEDGFLEDSIIDQIQDAIEVINQELYNESEEEVVEDSKPRLYVIRGGLDTS